LLSLGIRPHSVSAGVKTKFVNIHDMPSEKIGPHLHGAVDFINEALTTGNKVLVHW